LFDDCRTKDHCRLAEKKGLGTLIRPQTHLFPPANQLRRQSFNWTY
jgi:hypothetical protein